jgi:hypothetical protein
MIDSRGLVGPKPHLNRVRAKGKQVHIPAPRTTLPCSLTHVANWSTAVAVSKAITLWRTVMVRRSASADGLPFGGVLVMPGARENRARAIVCVRTKN